ncbi:MAG TPA: DUF4421 domain-containing protein [Cyclobacteriaceae bacterium]|jgi:hypothetical protein|nr:DUF4421 domain-containing protein [Cyclobacteriaceae bacterium]HLT81691.1 DUF4421 domain-containing protein [Cyclobacteriaceae bacterium]
MRYWFFLCCGLSIPGLLLGQFDTSYYVSYEDQLTARFYLSQKYVSFRYIDSADDLVFQYLPNTTLNMGVGATYRWATLNLAYGFAFLNPENGKGETKYFDLQGHFYGRRVTVDIIGHTYKGFYLSNDEYRSPAGDYYLRPDMRLNGVGLTGQYILNADRFSYRAGFLQNEWQKKSAGTVLVGWQLVLGSVSADSSLVPQQLDDEIRTSGPDQVGFFETGPSLGYAYQLVIGKHFYVMGSLAAVFTFGTVVSEGETRERSSSFIPNVTFHAFAGYNSETWAISLTYTNSVVNIRGGLSDEWFSMDAGNVRLNFARRFRLKRDLLDGLGSKARRPARFSAL